MWTKMTKQSIVHDCAVKKAKINPPYCIMITVIIMIKNMISSIRSQIVQQDKGQGDASILGWPREKMGEYGVVEYDILFRFDSNPL